MNVQPIAVEKEAALLALREYRQHRDVYDKRDWEIERIYRAISKGKIVISVQDAIRRAGFDDKNRPKLAIARADAAECFCRVGTGDVLYSHTRVWNARAFKIDWPGSISSPGTYGLRAEVPRIPPQHRPATASLGDYHLLWEAHWTELPRDPYLLKRIGKDAWVVLAAWDLTDVELSVLRAHQAGQK